MIKPPEEVAALGNAIAIEVAAERKRKNAAV
jgi:hypothetical protein